MSTTSFDLSTIRHSASHVLAQAVLVHFPDAKLGIGPAIDDGFYYDFDLEHAITPDDLLMIEKTMKAIIKQKQAFRCYTLNRADAEAKLSEMGQSYKLDIIRDLNLADYSFYENGPFVDLCRGPHVNKTNDIGAVKLLRVSGAYWRGDEKNKMLQRIYGTAFHTKEALAAYLTQLEEAKKRDHRLLGKTLDLFTISDEIGGGLVLWKPKGARIRTIMETYWRDAHYRAGYELLYTPHLGKGELWKTSGHLDFYSENMYAAMEIDQQDYYIKPMNCPFHVMIYKDAQHSYRHLPVRYAELGTVYRFERSGVLHGLMRVRGFTQDDAHIICTREQMHDEILSVLRFCQDMLVAFGFDNINVFLSTRPKEKYVGKIEDWDAAERAWEAAVTSLGIAYQVDDGGGAFYGPKIDIKIRDAIGREWQCSTVQFDFNLPERFDMTYVGEDGEKHRPFMIHRALLGSIERFFGIMVEHYAGNFPLWLAPVQVKILSVNDDVKPYCTELAEQLKVQGYRVECDFSNEKLGYKIRQATQEKLPYTVIVGRDEMAQKTLSVRKRGNHDLGKMSLAQFIETELTLR